MKSVVLGITGAPGAGKTASAVKMALAASDKGTPVWVPYGMTFRPSKGTVHELAPDLSNLMEVRNAFVLLDEVQFLMPSANWRKLLEDTAEWLFQARKVGVQVVWTAMDEMMADISLRRVTFASVHCRSIGRWIHQSHGMGLEFRRPNEKRHSKWVYRNRQVDGAYNTLETLGSVEKRKLLRAVAS